MFATTPYTPDNLASLLSEAQDAQLMGVLGYEKTLVSPQQPRADLGAANPSLTWVWYTLGGIGLFYYLFTIHAYNWKAAGRP